jgi:SPP1 gp7 family putative phage head morphogenesis protein
VSGPADAQIAVEAFRQQLAGLEAVQVNRLVQAYIPVQENLDKRVAQVTALAQKRNLKPWQVMRLTAMTTLRTQLVGDIALFVSIIQTQIAQGQAAAVALAEQAAFQTMVAGLPPGITADMLASVGLEWNRLPREAFANFIGIAGDGQPVGVLLAELGPQSSVAVTEAISEGIATGKSPRQTARAVQRASGMNLTRAMSISRTETNRSFREASRLQYAANSNLVKGYRRNSAKDSDVCMACIALDGKLYQNQEPLDAHVNCRCAIVPETVTYQDLGLDVPMPPPAQNGRDWFRGQPEATQRKMMRSPARFESWKSGSSSFDDLVQVTDHPVWGKAAVVAPIKNLPK